MITLSTNKIVLHKILNYICIVNIRVSVLLWELVVGAVKRNLNLQYIKPSFSKRKKINFS